MGDGSEQPERPHGKRRTTLVTVGAAVLVAAVIGGVAALGSNLKTVGSADDGSTAPEGSLSIIGGSGDDPVGLAPELRFRNLASAPADASASITVTAANDESFTMFTTTPERPPGGDGQLVFRGEQSLGDQVVDLGPPPYRYSVVVTLEGTTYTGTGSWPDDRVTSDEPAVELVFDPPLPGEG